MALIPKKAKRRLEQSLADVEEEIERIKIARLLQESPATTVSEFKPCRYHKLPMQPFIKISTTDVLAKKIMRLKALRKKMYEQTPADPRKLKTQVECYCGTACLC